MGELLKESNFHNTSSGKLPRKQNLRHKNIQDHTKVLAGFGFASGVIPVSGWDLGAFLRCVVSFVPLLAPNNPLSVGLK